MPKYDLAGNPLPEDNTAQPQRDLAGNPLPTNQAPPPVNPSRPPAAPPPQYSGGAWPPPPVGAPNYPQPEANTSGNRQGVPASIAGFRWNWGAFILSWIWCFAHGLTGWGAGLLACVVLSFIPMVGIAFGLIHFGLVIYLAINGHRLAWENRRYNGGYNEYIAVETSWKNWGVGLFVAYFLALPILAAILFPVFSAAREKAREQSGYYSRPYSPAPTGQ